MPNNWVEGILYNNMRYANSDTGWNFDIDGIEPIQLTRYTSGQFYEWHSDEEYITKREYHRKLTCVVQLTDPNEYEGGNLEFYELTEYPKAEEVKTRGTAIFFPSFLLHSASPVTKGTRYSLAAWFDGPKWS